MVSVETLRHFHLRQVQQLVNDHLGAVVPGWALPAGFIASRLRRNPGSYIVDPWIVERKSLVALVRGRVCAVTHLLRYGDDTPRKGVGDISWILAWPEASDAAKTILSSAQEQMKIWGVTEGGICGDGLWVPVLSGVPDVWPHIIKLLEQSGYVASEKRQEAMYGGTLASIPVPGDPPIKGMSIMRDMGSFCTRFRAIIDGQAVSQCECCMDLSEGGRRPALTGWAELSEIETKVSWRNRGVGTWVLQHAIQWLRFGGYDRCVLSVTEEDESAGAGRFYQRFGWWPLVRLKKGWEQRKI